MRVAINSMSDVKTDAQMRAFAEGPKGLIPLTYYSWAFVSPPAAVPKACQAL